ncbi:MAG TPA: 16S rRNA (cytosine(1402)-N(4))-methyltransferase RsmH [Candidatus Saccharimonadales bacterium]
MSIKEHPPQVHIPVLLEKTLEIMHPKQGENYLDLTAGYGGHASQFLKATGNYETSVLVDRDAHTRPFLENLLEKGVEFRGSDFLAAAKQLVSERRTFDLILADLGVSSPQLDEPQRGFSFNKQGPLDMRMDNTQAKTAKDVVNTYSEADLVDIICRYGEEPRPVARRIAKAIVEARPFEATDQLADAIQATHRSGFSHQKRRIHPATRTFQALRIEVNDELKQVEDLMPLLPKLLNAGGRVGIISFHSLEDRLVKRYFSSQTASGYEAELSILTKKPISGALYDVHNPRSRSSKLRVAVKK